MSNKITWTTETRRLGDLLPWEPNPRQSTRSQAERIKDSIQEFGYSQLVEIEPDNTILDGHQRNPILNLLKEYGPDAEIECRVASRKFTEQERKKYIAFKHQGAQGEWDWDGMLNLYEFDELSEWGFDADELLEHGLFKDGGDDIFDVTSTNRDGQRVNYTWDQVKNSSNTKIIFGDIETRIPENVTARLIAILDAEYSENGSPVHETLEEIIVIGMNEYENIHS